MTERRHSRRYQRIHQEEDDNDDDVDVVSEAAAAAAATTTTTRTTLSSFSRNNDNNNDNESVGILSGGEDEDDKVTTTAGGGRNHHHHHRYQDHPNNHNNVDKDNDNDNDNDNDAMEKAKEADFNSSFSSCPEIVSSLPLSPLSPQGSAAAAGAAAAGAGAATATKTATITATRTATSKKTATTATTATAKTETPSAATITETSISTTTTTTTTATPNNATSGSAADSSVESNSIPPIALSLSSSFDLLDDDMDDEANLSRYHLDFSSLESPSLQHHHHHHHQQQQQSSLELGRFRTFSSSSQQKQPLTSYRDHRNAYRDQNDATIDSTTNTMSPHNQHSSMSMTPTGVGTNFNDLHDDRVFMTPTSSTNHHIHAHSNHANPSSAPAPSPGSFLWNSFQSMRRKARQRRAQRLLTMSSETLQDKLHYWFVTWCWDATDRGLALVTILVLLWFLGSIYFWCFDTTTHDELIPPESDVQQQQEQQQQQQQQNQTTTTDQSSNWPSFRFLWIYGFGFIVILRIFGRMVLEYFMQQQRRNRRRFNSVDSIARSFFSQHRSTATHQPVKQGEDEDNQQFTDDHIITELEVADHHLSKPYNHHLDQIEQAYDDENVLYDTPTHNTNVVDDIAMDENHHHHQNHIEMNHLQPTPSPLAATATATATAPTTPDVVDVTNAAAAASITSPTTMEPAPVGHLT